MEEPRRRWDDWLNGGGISLPERLRDMDGRMDRIERMQTILLVVMVADMLLTAGDLLARLSPLLTILHA